MITKIIEKTPAPILFALFIAGNLIAAVGFWAFMILAAGVRP